MSAFLCEIMIGWHLPENIVSFELYDASLSGRQYFNKHIFMYLNMGYKRNGKFSSQS